MTKWVETELEKLLTLNYGWSLPEKKRAAGEFPVYGSNGVVGYHNQALVESTGIIVGRKGSGGRVHLSQTPFCPIDTTFYTTQEDTSLDLKFLYYLLLHIDLQKLVTGVGVPGLNRELAYREKVLHPESKGEQRRIAHVLTTAQTAIEQQARLIALTRELKSALMRKLFTEGIPRPNRSQRPVRSVETEIGLVPESWDVVELASLLEDTEQVNLRTEGKRQIKYIDVSSISREYLRVETTTECLLKDAPGRARKKVKTGDVIFATVRPTLLRVAFIGEELNDQVCSTAFCVLRAKKDVSGKYIHYVVQREQFIKQLAAIESGASYPAVTDRQVKNQKVPKPKFDEQLQIAEMLDICDKKSFQHSEKKERLEELFRTLLHQLMTGQIRVRQTSQVSETCDVSASRTRGTT